MTTPIDIEGSEAKPDPFLWVQSDFGPNSWGEMGWVSPQDPRAG